MALVGLDSLSVSGGIGIAKEESLPAIIPLPAADD
jgi:hypothetical protein